MIVPMRHVPGSFRVGPAPLGPRRNRPFRGGRGVGPHRAFPQAGRGPGAGPPVPAFCPLGQQGQQRGMTKPPYGAAPAVLATLPDP
ncbi:hypothetical protein CENSYa_0749 [Cenarchaeum symbiosum A]|uniref:Uncharacterized protein n=1 Tax=Cenarchaeum symbiosum (strain A) TaxID=414004 RepID=A0RVL5_CENSY|nr:hypothetical protein CENSYa_0749 [Cenarchaeum symbiosum A]